jgi:hypothetical protein
MLSQLRSKVMPQFGASLTDDARGVIYDRKMFIINAGHLWPVL